jgi:hypothetical protein
MCHIMLMGCHCNNHYDTTQEAVSGYSFSTPFAFTAITLAVSDRFWWFKVWAACEHVLWSHPESLNVSHHVDWVSLWQSLCGYSFSTPFAFTAITWALSARFWWFKVWDECEHVLWSHPSSINVSPHVDGVSLWQYLPGYSFSTHFAFTAITWAVSVRFWLFKLWDACEHVLWSHPESLNVSHHVDGVSLWHSLWHHSGGCGWGCLPSKYPFTRISK